MNYVFQGVKLLQFSLPFAARQVSHELQSFFFTSTLFEALFFSTFAAKTIDFFSRLFITESHPIS
jgi:hypothetical protein